MGSYNLYVDAADTRGILDGMAGSPANIEIMYGEKPVFNLSFPTGTLVSGKTMTVILDDDTVFYEPTTQIAPAVMMGADHTITASEASAGLVSLEMATRTEKFRDAVNGKGSASCFLAVVMWTGDTNNDAVLLGQNSNCVARYLPSEKGASPVPIEPAKYYTKAEIDAIKSAMDTEVATATTAATTASTAASSASTSATSAEESASSASTSASTASTAATSASASATSAANSATAAAASATTAQNSATWAEGSDSAVEALGGTHSAKGWANSIALPAATSANADKVLKVKEDGTGYDFGVENGDIALQDGYYETLGAGTAENLIDKQATAESANFTIRSTGGSTSITEDGYAEIKEIQGQTHQANQMLDDTNENTVEGVRQTSMQDAVAGSPTSNLIYGRSFVSNQLVPESKSGAISFTNYYTYTAFCNTVNAAGDLTSWSVTGKTLVFNQLLEDKSAAFTENWTTILSTGSVSGGVMTLTLDNEEDLSGAGIYINKPLISGHTYMAYVRAKASKATVFKFMPAYSTTTFSVTTGYTTVGSRFTMTAAEDYFVLYVNTTSTLSAGDKVYLDHIMLVDLSLLTNDDAYMASSSSYGITNIYTLAYTIPEYGKMLANNYVPYNPGTLLSSSGKVVAVHNKNLADQSRLLEASGWALSSGWYTGSVSNLYSKFGISTGGFMRMCFKKNTQYTISFKYKKATSGNTALIAQAYYTDGTTTYLVTTSGTATAETSYTGTSTASKTIACITFTYSYGDTIYIKDLQLEEGTSATTYTAFSGSYATYSDMAGIQMSGAIRDTTKTITLTGTETWVAASTAHIFYFDSTEFRSGSYAYIPISNRYIGKQSMSISNLAKYNKSVTLAYSSSTVTRCYICDYDYTAVEDFKAYLAAQYSAGTPVKLLVYGSDSGTTEGSPSLVDGENTVYVLPSSTCPYSVRIVYPSYSFTVTGLTWDAYHYYRSGSTESLITRCNSLNVNSKTDKLVDISKLFQYTNVPTTLDELKKQYPAITSISTYDTGTLVHSTGGSWTTGVWNQMAYNGNFADGTTGWICGFATLSASGNILTLTAKIPNLSASVTTSTTYVSLKENHVYYVSFYYKGDKATTVQISYSGNSSVVRKCYTNVGNFDLIEGIITTLSSLHTKILYIYYDMSVAYAVGESIQIEQIQIIDLTILYGEGNEPTTVDAVKTYCTSLGHDLSTYQAYNTGTALNGTVDLTGIELQATGTVCDYFDTKTGKKYSSTSSVAMSSLALSSYTSPYSVTSSSGTTYYYVYINCPSDMKTGGHVTAYATTSGYQSYLPEYRITDLTQMTSNYGVVSTAVSGYICVFMGFSSALTSSIIKTLLGHYTLYYESTSPTTTQYTAQPITLREGYNVFYQNSGDIPQSNIMTYTGSQWTQALNSSFTYLHRRGSGYEGGTTRVSTDTMITSQTSIDVQSGDKLYNLTQWFGIASAIPATADAFWTLYPNAMTMPKTEGTVIPYKGTGLKTLGWNLLNLNPTTEYQTETPIRGAIPLQDGMLIKAYAPEGCVFSSRTVKYSVSGNTITSSVDQPYFGVGLVFRAIPKTQYTLSAESLSSGSGGTVYIRCVWYTAAGEYIDPIYSDIASSGTARTLTTTSPARARWGVYLIRNSNNGVTCTVVNPAVHIRWSGYRDYGQTGYRYDTYSEYTRPLPIDTYFPNGMCGNATIMDTLTSTKAIKRWGKVDMGTLNWIQETNYQSTYRYHSSTIEGIQKTHHTNIFAEGFVPSVHPVSYNILDRGMCTWTDGCVYCRCDDFIGLTNAQVKAALSGKYLYYQLATPVETTINPPLNLTYHVSDFGMEQSLPENPVVPTTAPLAASIAYGKDFTRTIANIDKNYQSQDSMDDLNAQLGSAIGGTITKSWDSTNNKYIYTFTKTATVTTIAAATTAATLANNMRYIHAPTTTAVYTLPAPLSTTYESEIIVDVTLGSGAVSFKYNNVVLTPQRAYTSTSGKKYRFLCIYQFSAWKVYPIEVA